MIRFLVPLFALLIFSAAAPDQGGTLAERYERARSILEQERAAEEQLRQTRDQLAEEAQTLQERLVANAQRVQELEVAFNTTSDEIAVLAAREKELAVQFDEDREPVGELLAVIQRLDADEPPALVLRSDDSLAAARGAMMLGVMLPPLYEQAAILGRQLRALNETRAALEAKNEQARDEALALNAARGELGALLVQRRQQGAITETRLVEIATVTEEAARQTDDLKSLLDRIALLRAQIGPDSGMVVVTAEGGPAGLQRGSLIRPVVGTAISGDSAGPGLTPGTIGPQGLWFEANGASQAVAPTDSEVVFAGAYQNFGQVLILEIAGGYHLLLAGFGRIDVQIGDLVLAGEPVGVLPDGEIARLYLELRRNSQTMDPAPWMSAEFREALIE
ncbi:MAG: peptidoglycan DD-metalloendopeptidase family protein [Micropepsaceae bacterium]